MLASNRSAVSESNGGARFGVSTFLLLVALVWVDQSTFATGTASDGAGSSFQVVMDHFFHARARAGVDWIFTYGPLGYLQDLTYDPEFFVARFVVVDLAWKAICAVLFVRACLREAGPCASWMPVALLVLLPIWGDAYFYLVLLAAAELVLDDPRSTLRAIAFALVAIPLSLGKFSFCAVALPLTLFLVWARWRGVDRRSALRFAGAFTAAWIGSWLLLGQSLLDLPMYFARSLRMARAYGEAMNTEAAPDADSLGIVVLLLVTGLLALTAHSGWRVVGGRVRSCVRGFVLLVAYKAGAVRGFDHWPIFLGFASIAVFLFRFDAPAAAGRVVMAALLRAGVVVLAWIGLVEQLLQGRPPVSTFAGLAGIQADTCWGYLTRFDSQHSMLDAMRADARAKQIWTGVRSIVGDDPIDVLSPHQDSLLSNGLNYRPRPVFVSYAALDGEFQDLNARFLDGPSAPKWLLFRPEAIDGRLETSEDALVPLLLARRWRPVYSEQGILLFRREESSGPQPQRSIVFERDVAFGEEIQVDALAGAVKLLEFEVDSTLAGTARKLLLRPAELHGRFTSVAGRTFDARLVPSLFEHGVVVSPVLKDVSGWMRWYEGQPEGLRSFQFLPPEPAWAFDLEIHVRITSLELVPPRGAKDLSREFLFPGLETLPLSVDERVPGGLALQAGELVRVFDAPTTVHVEIPVGHRVVRGEFGVLDQAWSEGACDGVALVAQIETDGAARPIFTRVIDPRAREEHRGNQSFEFEVDVDEPSILLLRIRPGPFQDARDDRVFLRRLRVD